MAIFLPHIDSFSPAISSEFSFEFSSWISNLIDTINSNLTQLQNILDLQSFQSYTATQITTLSPTWPNGVIVYDSTNNLYVGKQSGALVKFTTTPYP